MALPCASFDRSSDAGVFARPSTIDVATDPPRSLRKSTGDLLKACPQHAPARPRVGITPRLPSPNWWPWRWCRPCWGAPARPGGCATPAPSCAICFPYLPQQPGYNKRPRGLAAARWSTTVWCSQSPRGDIVTCALVPLRPGAGRGAGCVGWPWSERSVSETSHEPPGDGARSGSPPGDEAPAGMPRMNGSAWPSAADCQPSDGARGAM